MKNINRRKFFGKVSLGAIGAVLLSTPLQILAKRKRNLPSKINIKLNKSSVKRNK